MVFVPSKQSSPRRHRKREFVELKSQRRRNYTGLGPERPSRGFVYTRSCQLFQRRQFRQFHIQLTKLAHSILSVDRVRFDVRPVLWFEADKLDLVRFLGRSMRSLWYRRV